MLNNKVTLTLWGLAVVAIGFNSCKKYDTIPDLGTGNELNPELGIEFVKLDSHRVYNTVPKVLKCYISAKISQIQNNGFEVSKINVYKNGSAGTYLIPSDNSFQINSVYTGQVYNFEFTAVDSKGRESKKSKKFTVVI